jgi:hypothetical protein
MDASTVEKVSCEQLELFPTCRVIDFARAAAAIRRRGPPVAEATDSFAVYCAAMDKIGAHQPQRSA